MEAIIYFLIFLMGAFFGSFFTLAVYRIPKGEDITHTHSYCPTCGHRLGVLDLFPIFSYLFLRGKCRYCHSKIRIRYFLLEILSGLTFLLFALSLHINFYEIEISKLIYFGFAALYFCSLFIIAGIDKEKKTVQNSVLIFGLVVVTGYILYLYIVGQTNIYRYVIYLIFMLIFVLIQTILMKKKAKENYTLQILNLCIYMTLFTGEETFFLTVIFTLLSIGIHTLIDGIIHRKEREQKEKMIEEKKEEESKAIPIGFYLCVTNIILMICLNFLIL